MALKKGAAKKPKGNNKRGPKAKQFEEKKPKIEVEADENDSDEEQNGINFNDGSDSEAADATDLGLESEDLDNDEGKENDDDDESEEDENDDGDDDEMVDDEVEPGEVIKVSKSGGDSNNENDDADSDEEPNEAPIGKKDKQTVPPQTGGIPKFKTGRIPPGAPQENILFVTGIPINYKLRELAAVFAKFGKIVIVNHIKSIAGGNHIRILFETAEAVDAALAAKDSSITYSGQVLNVSRPQNRNSLNERTVVVGLIGTSATQEQIEDHFKDCGVIEAVNFSRNRNLPSAFVRFASVDALPKALNLHGSEFHSRFITVRQESYKAKQLKSPEFTLMISNTGGYESFKPDIIEEIFEKYGEVVDVDIVCTRATLGFVTYKKTEFAAKALKELNGKTVNDLQLKLDTYHLTSSNRTVLVTNLPTGTVEKELRSIFTKAGTIANIMMFPHKAIITFSTEDGFCKSFLLNETLINGQPIFIEPNSMLKHKIFNKKRAKPHFNKFRKRPAQDHGSTTNAFKKAKKV